RTALQTLVIAELHTAQVHDAVHHRRFDVLALVGMRTLEQRTEDTDDQVQPRTGVTDLRTGQQRDVVAEARGAHRAAHGLSDRLISLQVGKRAGRAEALDGRQDTARVDFRDFFPRIAQPVQHAWPEV